MKGIQINNKWKPYLVFAILTFILYGNTLNHFYVFDDVVVMTNNRFTQQGIKGIPDLFKYDSFVGYWMNLYNGRTIEQLNNDFKLLEGGRYRPLSLVTFALEVEFCGKENIYPNSDMRFIGNAFVSHLINILLYLFTSCLLFLILHRLFPFDKDQKWYVSFSFIVTLLFLSHPIHTEVVANIKGRDEIMAFLGSLGALWFTIKYMDDNKYHKLVMSGLCLFLGLLSKENAITFLAVIPLTIYYFVNQKIVLMLKSMIPLIIVSALFLIIRDKSTGFDTSNTIPELLNNPFLHATKSETLATAFFTLLIYIKLLFFPHPLTYDYYPYHIEIANWSNPVVIISLFFYVGIGLYAVYGFLKKRDVFSWSIWFYLLPLSVVSNLFFQIGVFMGERFIYFSSIGFAIFTAWLICRYVPGLMFKVQSSPYFVAAVVGIILCLYSLKTITRNRAWKDNFTLFTTDIETSKNSIKGNRMASSVMLLKAINPNNVYETQKRNEYCDEAAHYLKRTINIFPQDPDPILKIADLYFNCYGDVAQSLYYCAMALALPVETTFKDFMVDYSIRDLLNMTHTLLDEQRNISSPEEIIQSCDELLKVKPDIGEVYYIKGQIYGKYLNNVELALINFEQALSMDFPKTTRFYEYLGTAYGFSGDYTNAIQYLLKAVESGTDDFNTYLNLSIIYKQLGDMDNANLYASKGNEMQTNMKK